MEKSYSLECLDYSIYQTRIKRADYNSTDYITKAILLYMKEGNAQGFTRNNNARMYIAGDGKDIPAITKEEIEEELFKHVIKSKSVKEKNGFAQLLGTNKNFSTARTVEEAEQVIYQAMGSMHMEGIRYAMEQYPRMYKLLIANFVEERYFNNKLGPKELDQPMNSYENDYYYKKIDEYYKTLRLGQVQGEGMTR